VSQKKLKKLKSISLELKKVDKEREVTVKSPSVAEIFKKDWWFVASIVVILLGIFYNAFGGDFVSDDYATIAQNPDVANVGILGSKMLVSSYLANTLVGKFFGVIPLPYHMFSILLFILIVVLSFILAYKLFGRGLALIGTLFFAVHPIHVEAVSWISGKPYLFIGLFLVIIMLLFVAYMETRKWWLLALMGLVFLEAFLTDNPRPFSIFALLPLVFILKGYKVDRATMWKLIGLVVGAGFLFLLFAWPHITHRIEAVNGGINSSGSIFYDPFFQYPTGIAKYLQLLLVPVDLTLYHTMFVLPVWLNWAIFLTYFGTIVYFYFKDKRIFFSLAFVLVAILPSMAPIKVSWLVAERYAFLASWGWCMFMAIMALKMWKYHNVAGGVVIVVLSVVFGWRLVIRNMDWQTNHKLWVNTCQVSPNSHNAWNNIGDDYDKLKDYPNAVKGFTQSVLVKPNYADAYHNRANILFKTGRLDLAREMYETGLRFSPGLYQSYISLVQIDLMEKRGQEALGHLEGMAKIEPNNPQTWYVASIVFDSLGDRAKALEATKRALTINANFGPAREMYLKLTSESDEKNPVN
jgi:hypothetical protein